MHPLSIAAVLCLFALVAGCSSPADGEAAEAAAGASESVEPPASDLPPGVSREEVEEGRRLYVELGCHACHGGEGEGTQLGPALADGAWIGIDGEPGEIERVIVEGVRRPREHPTAMPALGDRLDSAATRALVGYVRTLPSAAR